MLRALLVPRCLRLRLLPLWLPPRLERSPGVQGTVGLRTVLLSLGQTLLAAAGDMSLGRPGTLPLSLGGQDLYPRPLPPPEWLNWGQGADPRAAVIPLSCGPDANTVHAVLRHNLSDLT